MFSIYAGKLRTEFLQQHALYQAGHWDYCKTLSKRHRRRVFKVLSTALLMNVIGYALLVLFVSHHWTSKSLANPAVGLIMFPIGMALNYVLAFRDQRTDMFNLDPDDMFGGSGRWLFKTLLFTALGQGSYQIMVTLLNWNYKEVRIGLMCIVGPVSLAANYWVFRRKVQKARKAPLSETATEMT
ncbi:MAG TPA: hypothetical protein VMT23_01015 [Candidatus Binatia bacterium]|nr:hypothetical protein [Candidatus Binatia bacterium]